MMKSDPKSVRYAARRRSIAIVQVAVAVLLLFFSKFVQCMGLFMAHSCPSIGRLASTKALVSATYLQWLSFCLAI